MASLSTVSGHLVDPRTLKGFRDYLPQEMILRNRVIDKIRRVYEGFGFLPIDTPVLEHLTTLIGTGGEAINKELFRLNSPEGEPVAMRFDLTVPFARIVAQYPNQIKLPFRRYHIGPVFRADKPGPGRLRQFTQFDIDAAGSDCIAVDAEIIAAMCEVMRALGLKNTARHADYQIRVNDRRLMDALLNGCMIREVDVQKHVLRVIDKLQKVGLQSVQQELAEGRVDESGDPIPGVGLSKPTIDLITQFVSAKGNSRRDVVAALSELLPDSEASCHAIEAMYTLDTALKSLGISESEAVFDPRLTRGLDYYTGPVFEAFLCGAPSFGSVMGGGRYDRLVERFLDRTIPGTGVSIGLERLIDGLVEIGKAETCPTTTKVIVLSTKDVPVSEPLSVARELRNAGFATDVYVGTADTSMRDQFSYANAMNIPIAVILGPSEIESGFLSVKDLYEGREQRAGTENRDQYKKGSRIGQLSVPRADLVKTVKALVRRIGNKELGD